MSIQSHIKKIREKPQHEREKMLVIAMAIAAPILLTLGITIFLYERSGHTYSEWNGLKNLGNETINMIHSSNI
jgi:hypothetical protein